jgi:hypothetical protein
MGDNPFAWQSKNGSSTSELAAMLVATE